MYCIGVEYIRPNKIGIVGLDTFFVQLRVRVPYDVPGQEHAHRLAADTAGADDTLPDVHQVMHGKVLPAQSQALRLIAQQAAEYILLNGPALFIHRFFVAVFYRVEHTVPAVPALAGLSENVEYGIELGAGGESAAMAALQLYGIVHVLRLPPGHLYRVDVGTAVNIAYIYQNRSGGPDAGDGVVYVPLIFDAGVGYGVAAVAEGAGEAEEVAHHMVGKPEMLKTGETVGYEYAVLRFGADYPVYLHGEGLKTYRRVKHIFFYVGPPLYQGLVVHHLGVVGKAQVYNSLLCPRHTGHQLAHHKDIVPHVLYLPGNRISPAKIVQGLVQALNACADILDFFHWHTSLCLCLYFRFKAAALAAFLFDRKIITEQAGLWQ